MLYRNVPRLSLVAVAGLGLALGLSCAPEYRPCLLGGTCGKTGSSSSLFAGETGETFTEVLLQQSTFVEGRVVTTRTHRVDDITHSPVLIDFNGDGKVDPVIGYYQGNLGVVQILLSYGDVGTTQYASLTLDGGDNSWAQLLNLAVGDIDGDGSLDIVAATRDGVVYLHHPSDPEHTHVLSEWGQSSGDLELIESTDERITDDELTAILAQAIGPAANLDNYIVTVQQGYTSLELADFDSDGFNDIAASRSFRVDLEPKPDVPVEPILIIAGSIQMLINPGGATDGVGWTATAIGQHERHTTLDREGARDLRASDVDGDGDLDLISTAADDQNAQVAWFENPGGPGTIDPLMPWTQHRIGSVRGAFAVDVADLTGDGRVDVVATSPTQKQLVMFVQPDEVSERGFDWYTVPIVQFESFEPRSVVALDVDNDDTLELVLGGTNGAVRYFESPANPIDEWSGEIIVTFDPSGDVGLLGYGDLDGDGDTDLVAVVDTGDGTSDRLTWIRNELIP